VCTVWVYLSGNCVCVLYYVKVMNLTIRRHTRRMSNKVARARLMPARSTCTKLQR